MEDDDDEEDDDDDWGGPLAAKPAAEPEEVDLTKPHWQWKYGKKGQPWKAYYNPMQQTLRANWRQEIKKFDLVWEDGTKSKIDFDQMTQTNPQTGTVRAIRFWRPGM